MSEESLEFQAPVAAAEPTPLQVIQQAIQTGADPAVIHSLIDAQERMMRNDAEQKYNQAMVRTQSEIKPVFKGASNPQTHSRYAKYEDMHRDIWPTVTENGFSVMYSQGEASKPDMIRINATVLHEAGHSKDFFVELPADDRGIKGQQNKTDLHGVGSTFSYGRRYLESMIFAISFTDEDTDGNREIPTVTDEQVAELLKLTEEAGMEAHEVCELMKINILEELPQNRFPGVVRALKLRAAK